METNTTQTHSQLNPQVNPQIVLREEFDDWAILFDPNTGEAYTINPVGVYLWKQMDGKNSLDMLISSLNDEFDEVPEAVMDDGMAFIDMLKENGLLVLAN